jgi:hypothetical protein
MKVLFCHIAIVLIICNAGAQQTQIIGHRGAMGHAPENTVLSVQKALALDVDGIEIDVNIGVLDRVFIKIITGLFFFLNSF